MKFYSEKIFPAFYDLVVRHRVFDQQRERILKKAGGKILEVGAGTGINLDYYPKTVKEITVIEPNPGMKKQFELKANGHRIKVNFFLCGAEKMPFENESFDTVISTITLCSIPLLKKALLEIKRVMKSDGQFLFLDHGLSQQLSVARLQNFINPIWKQIGVGCHLNRNYETELLNAGFRVEGLTKYHLQGAPKFIASVYEGIATKKSEQ